MDKLDDAVSAQETTSMLCQVYTFLLKKAQRRTLRERMAKAARQNSKQRARGNTIAPSTSACDSPCDP